MDAPGGDRDEVVAFAYEALAIADAQEVRRAAIRRIVQAVGADAGELMTGRGGSAELQTTVSLHLPERLLSRDSAAMPAAAVTQERPVIGELQSADFEQMPQLAADRMRYGIAVAMVSEDVVRVGAAYSRERPFTEADAAPIFGCGSLLAAAVARIEAEQRLAERDAMMQMILDELPAVVWIVDAHLNIDMIRGSGMPRGADALERLIGKSLPDVLHAQRTDRDYAIRAHQQALGGEAAEYSYPSHQRMWDVSVRPLRSNGSIRGCLGLAFDVTDRERTQSDLRTSREELRHLAARLSEVQEDERRRIARELHDDMGQRLTALRFELDLLRREAPQTAARVEQMASLIRAAADAMRRISADLRPSALDHFGLSVAIENDLAVFQRRTGIRYDLELPAEEPALDGDQTVAIYRIVQEALTNVARHSGASHVRVTGRIADDYFVVEIADNGRGITTQEATGTRSLGLLGARERAYALGGKLEVEGRPGGGSTLRLRVPLTGKGS